MADDFTSDHCKLLNRWEGQKPDESNPEQNRAYEDLKKAYGDDRGLGRQRQGCVVPDEPRRDPQASDQPGQQLRQLQLGQDLAIIEGTDRSRLHGRRWCQ